MELTIDQTRSMLVAACDAVVANVDRLTKADQLVGDGDHGVGMARGFKAAKAAIEEVDAPASVGELFKAGGQAIIATSGGASGIVFGTLLRAAAKPLSGTALDADALATWLESAAEQIQARGKASPGDKTMVDAIVPAAAAARRAAGEGLQAAAEAALAGAQQGMEATVDMVAKFGKAQALGERSVGHPDPGALSTVIILEAVRDYIASV